MDRTIPIEETWKEMAALQAEGKVKYLGISEATAEEIRRANSVAKVSALQIEVGDLLRDSSLLIILYHPVLPLDDRYPR